MKFQRLSPRQNLAMTWWNRPGFERYDGIICDGSIRSGKTVAMTVGFVMWAMARFNDQNFAICGKTIESLRRNVTSNLPKWLAGVFSFKEHRTENKIVVSAAGRSNSFYLFGGKDESSASLIQGITLAGILLDEVALMPESFVNQATGRCSVAGSSCGLTATRRARPIGFTRNGWRVTSRKSTTSSTCISPWRTITA